ncbi:putative reverse transcriptase domain-containing protein [Tanacetum coccineum]|uniref:Reverse transcriptase domain-containing protein n=1 Tax=Tanacetum coccineum TaxID=301880 RepID=A0ABQ5HQW3_9ASTR
MAEKAQQSQSMNVWTNDNSDITILRLAKYHSLTRRTIRIEQEDYWMINQKHALVEQTGKDAVEILITSSNVGPIGDEKIVCIPFGNETLIVCGDGSNNGRQVREELYGGVKEFRRDVQDARSLNYRSKSNDQLTQQKVKFDWGDKQEAAFQLLKEKLYSAHNLALPEGAENFIVYCDASHKGLVLM